MYDTVNLDDILRMTTQNGLVSTCPVMRDHITNIIHTINKDENYKLPDQIIQPTRAILKNATIQASPLSPKAVNSTPACVIVSSIIHEKPVRRTKPTNTVVVFVVRQRPSYYTVPRVYLYARKEQRRLKQETRMTSSWRRR